MAKKKATKTETPGAQQASPSVGAQFPLRHRPIKQTADDDSGEFSPTERDLQAYEMHSKGISADEIAKVVNLSKRQVFDRLRKTAAWWRAEKIGDILEVRTQISALLMRHYRELEALWNVARTAPTGEAAAKGEPVRLDRPIQIIKEMRNTLETIGEFNGAYTQPEDRRDGDDGERVAGTTRADYIRRTIIRYQEMYEREIVIEQSKPKLPGNE